MMLGAYMAWFLADGAGLSYPLAVVGAVAITALQG